MNMALMQCVGATKGRTEPRVLGSQGVCDRNQLRLVEIKMRGDWHPSVHKP